MTPQREEVGNLDLIGSRKLHALIILGVFILLNFPFLTVFPPLDNLGDESWMMNISSELLRTGRPAPLLPNMYR